MRIDCGCACGATITIEDSAEQIARDIIDSWSGSHLRHRRTIEEFAAELSHRGPNGACGHRLDGLFPDQPMEVCVLPFGHYGMHHSARGSDWTIGLDDVDSSPREAS